MLPRGLTGWRWIPPGRRKKLRRLIKEYRLIAASPLFDLQWYLAKNPDVALSGKIRPFITSCTAVSKDARRAPILTAAHICRSIRTWPIRGRIRCCITFGKVTRKIDELRASETDGPSVT